MRYLGLDLSTQSVTALVIDSQTEELLVDKSVGFGSLASRYGVTDGVVKFGPGGKEVLSFPSMWAEALDRLFLELKEEIDISTIAAVSGSGQQHATVYLNSEADQVLASLDPGQSLELQILKALSRLSAPNWQDSSTTEQCRQIVEAVGEEEFFQIAGNVAFERFSGPQIRKIFLNEPDAYDKTAHVALASSFLASLLAGKVVPIEPGDGAGTHLMNIDTKQFDDRLLDATADGLKHKLLTIEPSTTIAGKIADYYVQRHGFSPDCDVVLGSGDNPCSLIGLGLVEPGHFALSLGTSDTLFACTETPTRSRGKGCVFCSPDGEHYMALLCRSNGSLARKSVCERYFGKEDWDAFARALAQSPPGNNGKMMLPFFEPEIVPKTAGAVVVRQGMDESDAEANIRAVVEAQAMSFAIHAEYMGPPSMLRVTGGASRNEEILRIHANVFDCPVASLATPNAAALGAALRAAYSHRRATEDEADWRQVVDPFTQLTGRIEPAPAAVAVYRDSIERYRSLEAEHTG